VCHRLCEREGERERETDRQTDRVRSGIVASNWLPSDLNVREWATVFPHETAMGLRYDKIEFSITCVLINGLLSSTTSSDQKIPL